MMFLLGAVDLKQNERQPNSLVVTVLKTQYIKAIDKQYTGGLTEEIKSVEEIAVYPEMIISSPLFCYKITQGYFNYHRAYDLIPADCNDYNIYATHAGTVIYADWMKGYGNHVEVLHANGVITTYSHLSKINVKVSDEIKNQEVLGIIGSTGYSTGPHLHFEIIYNGIKLNPKNYLN